MTSPKRQIQPADPRAKEQATAAWIFGSALLAFYLWVFAFGPDVLPDHKQRMLGLISAILAAFLAYFWAGAILLRGEHASAPGTRLGIQAGGAIAAGVGVLFYWYMSAPVQRSSDAAKVVVDSLEQAAQRVARSSGSGPTSAVPVGSSTKQLARSVAASDPAYASLSKIGSSDSIGTLTYLRTKAAVQSPESSAVVSTPALPTVAHTLSHFAFDYDFEDVNGRGPRTWERQGNTWSEHYPNGKSVTMETIGKITVEGDSGTLVRGGSYEYFIPDAGSSRMWIRIRLVGGNWSILGIMRDIR